MNLILNINQTRFLAELLEPHRTTNIRQIQRLVEKVDKLMEEVIEADRHMEAVKQALRRGDKPPFQLISDDGCLTAVPIQEPSPAERRMTNARAILCSLHSLEPKLRNGWRSIICKETDGTIVYRLWKEPCEEKDENSLQFCFDPAEWTAYEAMCEINHTAPLEVFSGHHLTYC